MLDLYLEVHCWCAWRVYRTLYHLKDKASAHHFRMNVWRLTRRREADPDDSPF
jgi:hypothetical protein